MVFEKLPGGTLLRVVNDGGFMAGQGAKFLKLSDSPHTVEVMIKGRVYSITRERLQKCAC